MDDIEDDARYPQKSFAMRHRHNAYLCQKHPIRSIPPYARPFHTRYEEEDEEDDLDDYDNDHLGYEEEEYDGGNNGHGRNLEEDDDFDRNQKKRKLRSSAVSGYGFVPRVSLPYGVRSSSSEWTEHATFVLLEVWGDRFLQLGRKSLRSEDWHEVAEQVSEELKLKKKEERCRSILDKLKRRYQKEKAKVEEMGLGASKWAFFKKMDMLMASSQKQECGLACGVDSGEYVFMNTRVYLNRSNEFDEMRDSPGDSEAYDDENDSDGLPSKRQGFAGRNVGNGNDEDGGEESSFRMLANSVQKFGKIYEKIENSKRQQMMELEKMRLDFHRELELQKNQILDRAHAEIAKLQEQGEDGDESDDSAENLIE